MKSSTHLSAMVAALSLASPAAMRVIQSEGATTNTTPPEPKPEPVKESRQVRRARERRERKARP